MDGALLLLLNASKAYSVGGAPDRLLLAFDDVLLRATTQRTIVFPPNIVMPDTADGTPSPDQAAALIRSISDDPQLRGDAAMLALNSRQSCDRYRSDQRFAVQLREVLPPDSGDAWVADAMCTSAGPEMLLVDYLSCGGAGGVCFRSFALVGQEGLSEPMTDGAGALDLIEYAERSSDSFVGGRRRGDYAHPSEMSFDAETGMLALASERDLLVIERYASNAREWRFPGLIQHVWMLRDGRIAVIESSSAALHIIDVSQLDQYGATSARPGAAGPPEATTSGLVGGVETGPGPAVELRNYRSDGLSIEHCRNRQSECRTVYRSASGIESFVVDRQERFMFVSEVRPGRFLGGRLYSLRSGRVWRTFGPAYKFWPRVEFTGDSVIVDGVDVRYPTLSTARRNAIAELTPGCVPARRGDYASSPCWRGAAQR